MKTFDDALKLARDVKADISNAQNACNKPELLDANEDSPLIADSFGIIILDSDGAVKEARGGWYRASDTGNAWIECTEDDALKLASEWFQRIHLSDAGAITINNRKKRGLTLKTDPLGSWVEIDSLSSLDERGAKVLLEIKKKLLPTILAPFVRMEKSKKDGSSEMYLHVKRAIGNYKIRALLAERIAELVPDDVTAIAVMSPGVAPLAGAVATLCKLPLTVILGQEGGHGVGFYNGHEPEARDRYALIDDVIDSGKGSNDAVEIIEKHSQATVSCVLAVYKRGDGSKVTRKLDSLLRPADLSTPRNQASEAGQNKV